MPSPTSSYASTQPFISTKRPLHSPRKKGVMIHCASFSSLVIPWISLCVGCFLGHLHGRYYHTFSSTPVSKVSHGLAHALVRSKGDHPKQSVVASSISSSIEDSSGWRTLDVFIGDTQQASNDEAAIDSDIGEIKWYSQASQDQLISALLPNKYDDDGQVSERYFIDLAANDATIFSNTYALEQNRGWKGLCIEPNPTYWYNLTHVRSCQVVAAVVGSARSQAVHFRHEAGDHGGIAGDGFDNGQRWQKNGHSLKEYTVTLQEILERYDFPKEIDYLSLDVEGAETFIMMNFPLSEYRIKIITAERLRGEIRHYLKDHGYEFVQKLTRWGESLWIHSSILPTLDLSVLTQFGFPLG